MGHLHGHLNMADPTRQVDGAVYRVWGTALLLLVLYLAPALISFGLPDPRGGVPGHQVAKSVE